MDMQIALSREELILINNALNEVCNGVDIPDWEFQTRLGRSREEVRDLLAKIADLLTTTGPRFVCD